MIEVSDWSVIERTLPYVEAMRACIQDPVYHAEGDVWTHTKMVMAALDQFGVGDDRACRLTALYHDVAKPETRVATYDKAQGRETVSHPFHARQGAARAWYDLWLADEPLETRLMVYWLCRWHQKVFHIWDDKDMRRQALMFASLGSWPKLIGFANADNAGRICPDQQRTADNLSLLTEYLTQEDCGGIPIDAQFWQTDHDRLFYFEKSHRDSLYHCQSPAGSRVTILSGLPGVGKDHHVQTNLPGLPVVSLDTIREKLRIDATQDQGRVVQAALEQARVYLRVRRPFVWNAQGVTLLARGKIIRLCRDYDAHITIHAFDRPLATILAQNKQRARQVPEAVIMAAARKWEPPSRLETHHLQWV
jgi:predicted kinase